MVDSGSIERMVNEAENDFHEIEEDLEEAQMLASRIKKDLQESELQIKKLVSGPDGDGAIRAGADFDEETLRRDVSEIEEDLRNLHELMSNMNQATERFANVVGAWEGLDAFRPE